MQCPCGVRANLLFSLLAGIFDDTELTEDDLAKLCQADALSDLLNELGQPCLSLTQSH